FSGLRHRESLMLTFPFPPPDETRMRCSPHLRGDEERWRLSSRGGGAYLSGSDRAGIGGLFFRSECLEQIKRFALFSSSDYLGVEKNLLCSLLSQPEHFIFSKSFISQMKS
ncbi:uncharacterized, partial [Tachysurus ichikawai]